MEETEKRIPPPSYDGGLPSLYPPSWKWKPIGEEEKPKAFYKVETIHIYSSEPEEFVLIPHIGPEGLRGESVRVRASELKCLEPVESVYYDKDLTTIFMRHPGATCVLEDNVLTCRPEEEK
jgi:hypothetical protein